MHLRGRGEHEKSAIKYKRNFFFAEGTGFYHLLGGDSLLLSMKATHSPLIIKQEGQNGFSVIGGWWWWWWGGGVKARLCVETFCGWRRRGSS